MPLILKVEKDPSQSEEAIRQAAQLIVNGGGSFSDGNLLWSGRPGH